jgi:hypothetical protein
VREGEDHVEIRHGEQVFGSLREPLLAVVGLALRAMPVPARVVGDGLVPASGASIQMPAERLRPAVPDGAQRLQVRPREMAIVPVDKAFACRPNDIGHLEGWPIHFFTRFRERLAWSGLETSIPSRGLPTA